MGFPLKKCDGSLPTKRECERGECLVGIQVSWGGVGGSVEGICGKAVTVKENVILDYEMALIVLSVRYAF